jgi:hypothetical protein
MSIQSLRKAVSWALVGVLVVGTGAAVRANDEKPDGKVVKIGHSDGDASKPKLPAPEDREGGQRAEMPKYWVGLLAGPIPTDDPLRAQLDLPEGQGLRIERVMDDSPASKAGLKRHDIMLRANDVDLHDMHDLINLVATVGEQKGKITLDVLRKNKHETVELSPEDRPANAPVAQGGGEGGGQFGLPGDFMQQFGGQLPMEFRNFGNGVVLGGGEGFAGVPNGVSINIQKQDGKPAQATVKRGDETWNVTDDPESLKQLPDDLRPAVEGMLHGNNGPRINMRDFQRHFAPGVENGGLQQRMERLEKQIEEMQKHFDDSSNKDSK